MHRVLPFQPPKSVSLGTVNIIPIWGTDHLIARQKDDVAEDSSQWRKGLNYSSTHYVSDGTHAAVSQLELPERQSDIYADIFGGVANNDNENIREIREFLQETHGKLRNALGDDTAQLYLDKRRDQLEEVATKARNIRDKLDQVWAWGNLAKTVTSKIGGAAMLVQDAQKFMFDFGTRPKSAETRIPLQDPYSFGFKTFVFKGMALAVSAAWGTEMAIKKAFDWYPPEHFTGLKDSRKDIAKMAEDLREPGKLAKNMRAEKTVADALDREYGKDGRQFLERLMNEVDRSAYHYMQALNSNPSRFMQADDHLAESGVTSASLQLMYACLEEARFIDPFGQGNHPVVKELDLDPDFPGTCVLLEAKNPSKQGAQSSSQARHDKRAQVNFNSIEQWDYNSGWRKTLEDLGSKASKLALSDSATNWPQVESYLREAKKGDARCMFELGRLCERGIFRISQSTEVRRIAKQLYTPAANKGNSEAQYCLGLLHANNRFSGRLRLQEIQIAMEWLTKAADEGHRQAQEELNRISAANPSA